MIEVLFIIPLLGLIFISLFWQHYNKTFSFIQIPSYAVYFNNIHARDFIRLLVLSFLNMNLIYCTYLWKSFPSLNSLSQVSYPSSIDFNGVSVFELTHNLGLPFIILSSSILIVAFLTTWYSSVNIFLFSFLLFLIEFFLVGAFSCTNLFLFLLFFEASALPVFILIVYCGSPRRERFKASYYFLFFTLYGSISLLLLILNMYTLNSLEFLSSYQINDKGLWLLLFITFAVKIPLFPFHIWLPYAHVEASTSTSIILAALMLKLGGYGLIKFMLPMFTMDTHLFFRPFALFICLLGVIYGGLAAIRQIDLKRQIAFSSIAHMSFSTLGVFTFTEIGVKGSIYLMLSHGITSAALFFLVGVLSDRYHTRSIMSFSGLLSSMPVFSFFLLLMSLANVGFPGTSGFIPEFYVLISIFSTSPALLLPVIFGMFLTAASTLLLLLRVLFGHLKSFYFNSKWVDVTYLEFFVLSLLSFWVIFLGCFDILYWV